ncbi:hypothetical protein P691DRAFT_808272 [Macrolepiota fuliginosa MF-IS2]|uniref:Uncharacterized protein n=1 Tax=Macrolepiota fuliginosa MF-IS2 TaxID=1400762 RepID=A0A9P5XK99_9AGAR|nr:hypothetical protein P691DRAFT_808272 [Macrolepiota fuliginosa MF-IS2]
MYNAPYLTLLLLLRMPDEYLLCWGCCIFRPFIPARLCVLPSSLLLAIGSYLWLFLE